MQVVRKINELCVAPCMVEDEPYGVRTQKMFVIAFAMIAINALLVGVPNTVIQSLADPNAGAYITGFAMAQMSTFSAIIPYLYLRITRDLPPWVADFQMWSTVPMLICLGFFNHQCSSTICNSIIVLVAVIMRVRGWYIIVSIGICANLVNVLVNDFIEEVPQFHDALFHTQILPVKILYYIGCHLCPLVFFAGGLFFIMKEFGERSDQADAAIAMNLAVADKLRRYDTDGVAVILAAHKGKVDEKLLEAFAGIQHNLQEYRPHIPDYVIAASAGTEDSDGDDDDEGGLQDSSRVTLLRSRKSHHSVVVSGGEPEFLDESERKSVSSYSSRRNSNGSEMSRSRDVKYRRSTANTKLTPGQRRTTTMSASRVSSKSGNNPSGSAPKHQHFHGRATTVFVRFVSECCHNEGGNESIPKEKVGAAISVLNSCVNAASKHAKAHKGALQYMQGCGLMVSFNAASRVATHEANACAFALALKTAVGELAHPDLVMHATIVTTNVLSFFAGNTGQVMLTVLGGFMPVHTAMHNYLSQTVGKASSCILLGESVVPTIDMMFDHRLLGAFERRSCGAKLPTDTRSSIVVGVIEPMPTVGRGAQVTISQLIQSSQHDDDEWLYHAAERNEDDPISLGNKIVRAALDGDAVQLSTHCDPNDVVLVKCVKDRLEKCQEDNVPFSVTVETLTVMW